MLKGLLRQKHFITDEEAMAIYCYEILRGYRTISVIHRYAQDNLSEH